MYNLWTQLFRIIAVLLTPHHMILMAQNYNFTNSIIFCSKNIPHCKISCENSQECSNFTVVSLANTTTVQCMNDYSCFNTTIYCIDPIIVNTPNTNLSKDSYCLVKSNSEKSFYNSTIACIDPNINYNSNYNKKNQFHSNCSIQSMNDIENILSDWNESYINHSYHDDHYFMGNGQMHSTDFNSTGKPSGTTSTAIYSNDKGDILGLNFSGWIVIVLVLIICFCICAILVIILIYRYKLNVAKLKYSAQQVTSTTRSQESQISQQTPNIYNVNNNNNYRWRGNYQPPLGNIPSASGASIVNVNDIDINNNFNLGMHLRSPIAQSPSSPGTPGSPGMSEHVLF